MIQEPFDLFSRRASVSRSSPPHVIYLITGLSLGGAETQLVRLAICMKAQGWKVGVISLLLPRAFVEELDAAGIQVQTLEMSQGVPDLRALFRLSRILRQERPQVLHAHMIHANLLARLVRLIAPVPVVICTAHSTYECATGATHLREVTWREWAYRLTDPLCDLTTQISKAGFERYIRVKATPLHKICIVPNGVDVDRFHPDPNAQTSLRAKLELQDRFVWLAVGRLEGAKDYPNLLRAFARLPASNQILLIAGQGPLKDHTESLMKELGLEDQVRFLGIRKDIPELMNAADAYVMSSFYEGLPMVLLEAAATGLPIVATNVGGNSEIVIDNVTGYLVESQNPQALSEAMSRLMHLSHEARVQMGKAGQASVQVQYGLGGVVKRWADIYELLIADPSRSDVGSIVQTTPDLPGPESKQLRNDTILGTGIG